MTTTDPVRIGHYAIIREIGRGGMGVVYLARDTRLNRDVALKELPEALAADPDRLVRFEREARSLAQLHHPNVAAIFGIEESTGRTMLVLEFVDGASLAELLERGPLPIDRAIETALQIAAGVEAAHDAGVIHRDLKPGNIGVTADGTVKVLDFGLAKAAASDQSSSLSSLPTATTPRSPTIAGAIMGTAAYMSPEQARGKQVDRRTDVWAFGVILFEMLAGVNPFAGETVHDTLGAVLHRDPDFGLLPQGTPRHVRRVLSRCLQRDKSQRYHSIADARLDLEDARSNHEDDPGAVAAPAHPWRTRAGWIVAALIAAGAVVWAALSPAPRDAPIVHTAVVAPEAVWIRSFQISPEGSCISIIGRPEGVGPDSGTQISSLYVRDLSADDFVRVPNSAGVSAQRWSPDGRSIYFITSGAEASEPMKVMRVPRDISTPAIEVMLVPPEALNGPSERFCFTPRGELAFVDGTSNDLIIFDAGTGMLLRRLPMMRSGVDPQIGRLLGPFGDRHIRASRMVYTPTGFQLHAAVISTETGELSTVVEDARLVGRAPDGRLLYTRRDTLYAAPFDPGTLSVTGAPVPVCTGIAADASWGCGECEVAGNGSLVYITGGVQGLQRRIERIDGDGKVTNWSEERRAFDQHIAVSPDGSRLAVIIASPGGLYELWVSETDRPRLRRLVAIPGADCGAAAFTPDGRHIVYAQWNPGTSSMGIVNVVPFDGNEAPRRIFMQPDIWIDNLSVLADGTRAILTTFENTGATVLYEVALDAGAEPRKLLQQPRVYVARVPPVDVPVVAYISTDTGRAEAFVCKADEGGLGPPVPATTQGAWNLEWIMDPEAGLGILHFDMQWLEWFTPIGFEEGRIRIGDASLTGRLGSVLYVDRAITRSGAYFAIRLGEDERPPTQLELVQNWAASIGGD